MALKLNVYAKGSSTALATGDDTTGVAIKGLTAGAVVKDGDYQVTHTDDTKALTESDRVDVPGFTVSVAG